MSRTYKATGINLKGMPLGENDRLLTILTPELGLIRVAAPGARKHKSQLAGRSGLFVVNQLLIAKGRSLDRLTQAQTIESYPGLSQHLGKLTAGQYLAELVLCQALSNHPQVELYELFTEHLRRLERSPDRIVLPLLTQAIFHLLAIAGIAPQVQSCCITQTPLTPDFTNPHWQIGFSVPVGGTVSKSALERLETDERSHQWSGKKTGTSPSCAPIATEPSATYRTGGNLSKKKALTMRINAVELAVLQQLAQPHFLELEIARQTWLRVEQMLRQYAQYHFDRPLRTAALIETCFATLPTQSRTDNATV